MDGITPLIMLRSGMKTTSSKLVLVPPEVSTQLAPSDVKVSSPAPLMNTVVSIPDDVLAGYISPNDEHPYKIQRIQWELVQ